MSLSERAFTNMHDFLKKNSGISVQKDKMYLLESRLNPLVRKHGISSLEKLVDMVCSDQTSAFAHEVIDCMTTNETLFFRDSYPFNALREIVFPELMAMPSANIRNIKIWSAASSRGQEAYSIAMTALDVLPGADKQVKILATDLSPPAVEYAKGGIYSQFEVQRGMPIQELVKHFKQLGDSSWQVNDKLRGMLSFNVANLISDNVIHTVRHHSEFDVVFCRNVLIYFEVEERRKVIDRIAKVMRPGAYLFTGNGERVEGENSKWEAVNYNKRPFWKMLSAR